MASPNTFPIESQPSTWTWEENKMFEIAIVEFPENTADRWEKIANALPGKSAKEVEEHYEKLVDDVRAIDSGLFDETYLSESSIVVQDGHEKTPKRVGKRWTDDEHRLFLMGLNECGKGNWKDISRNFVKSKTPIQVASHAQKYFLRLEKNEVKKRKSIHDIPIEESTSSKPNLESNLGHTGLN